MIYLELFWSFFKIGLFTFGGGYAMIPLLRSEVISRGWMGEEELMNFIAVSESTPGPLATNMATYVGVETAGLPGALLATLAVILPSFILILLMAKLFLALEKNKYFIGGMNGLKAAVVGLILAALVTLAKTVFFPGALSFAVFGGAAFWAFLILLGFDIFLSVKKMHPILILLISAGFGIAFGYADKLLF